MTKLAKIREAVFSGRTLTTMQGAYEFGTTKLPNRLREIEQKYDLALERKVIKTDEGIRYYEYRLNKSKHKEQVKNYLKSIKN